MELNEFIKAFANIFDDTDESEFFAETSFKELDEWSSLTSLSVIAFVKLHFGKNITGMEIRSVDTVQELFELISKK